MGGEGQIVDAPEAVVERHEFTADRDTAERLAEAYVRYAHTRPLTILIMTASVAIVAVGAAALVDSWVATILAVAYGVGGGWIGYLVQRARVARQMRGVAAEGHRMQLEARAEGLWVRTELTEGLTDYRLFERVLARGHTVLLKTRNGSSYTLLPAALLPGPTLRLVRDRIEGTPAS